MNKTGQVDLGIADLGLNNLFVKIQDNRIVAACCQGKSVGIQDTVAIKVLCDIQNPVTIEILPWIEQTIIVCILVIDIQNTVIIRIFRRIGKTGSVIDGGRS